MPTAPPLVGPIVGLALWTFAMEVWLYGYRIPDVSRYNIKPSPEMTTATMNAKIPRHRQWPADNFNHLHEQPTVFYAIALSLTFLEANDSLTVGMAWTYVGIRVAHSLVQASSNIILLRLQIFLLSSLTLLGLTVRAAMLAF